MNYSLKEYNECNDEIRNLVETGLGETYSKNISSCDKKDSVLVCALHKDDIIGFACGYNSDDPEKYIEPLDTNTGSNSILEKIVVKPEFRGLGIGASLTEYRIEKLDKPIITELWIKEDQDDLSNFYERLGFDLVQKYENRWYKESKNTDDEMFCPSCGSICECDSAVYILR